MERKLADFAAARAMMAAEAVMAEEVMEGLIFLDGFWLAAAVLASEEALRLIFLPELVTVAVEVLAALLEDAVPELVSVAAEALAALLEDAVPELAS